MLLESNDKDTIKLRIKFSKEGPVKYIGHLDIMRFFQKAVRRSGIDIKYTGGYSPHQVMSFAQPLGVGDISDAEYLDIEVCSITSSEEMIKALDGQMVEGLKVLDIKKLPKDCKNAMSSIEGALYELYIKDEYEDNSSVILDINVIESLLSKSSITVVKPGKKGKEDTVKEIRDGIFKIEITDNSHLKMFLNASSSGNIKPEYVISSLYKEAGASDVCNTEAWQVKRIDLYTVNESGEYVSLGMIGDNF